MKKIVRIILFYFLSISLFGAIWVEAAAVDLDSVPWVDNIKQHSIAWLWDKWTISDNLEDVGFNILTTIKNIVSALLVLFLVYAGIQMILSMGTDEDKLSSSKRQLWYSLVALIFINIPGTFYKMFVWDKTNVSQDTGTTFTQDWDRLTNIFINFDLFENTINGSIITFLEVAIIWVAIFMITLSGIKIILSRGKEEDLTEEKNKILWSLVGLVFVWFIASWQEFVYGWDIADGTTIFETLAELILFFAGPVAIFFLTLAWYYYITSNGDEEKVKKAKNIIINVVIATLVILASYAFLTDLSGLNI